MKPTVAYFSGIALRISNAFVVVIVQPSSMERQTLTSQTGDTATYEVGMPFHNEHQLKDLKFNL